MKFNDREIDFISEITGRFESVNWYDAWKNQPAAIDWLYEPIIERGTVNALFGLPGLGKSLLALDIALTLVRDGHSVVYIDEENRIIDLVERLQDMGATPDELDNLVLYSFQSLPSLDTPEGGWALLALVMAAEADLVVLDTTTRMVDGRENDSDTFLKLHKNSLARLKNRKVSVLRLDHPGKNAAQGQRGSSAKDGDVDTIWKLTTSASGFTLELTRTKSRSGHGEVDKLAVTRHKKPLWHELGTADSSKILKQLDLSGVPRTAGRPACRAALDAAGVSVSNVVLSRIIKDRKAGA
jgi:RecA-family ATPase